MNPAAELLTGFTLNASCGRVLQDVVQCSQADDLARLLEPRDATDVASAAKRRAEEVFVHEDGHSYDVSLTVSALYDEHGTSVGTIIEAQDISQRTRAQAQLNDADRRYLRACPPTWELALDAATTLLCCHGSPRSYDEVIAAGTAPAELAAMLDGQQPSILAGGHTHRRSGSRATSSAVTRAPA